jgi:hypothetical protein
MDMRETREFRPEPVRWSAHGVVACASVTAAVLAVVALRRRGRRAAVSSYERTKRRSQRNRAHRFGHAAEHS